MKKTLLFLPFALLFGLGLPAQCNFSLPPSPGMVQVSTDTSLNSTGTIYWVCEDVNLTVQTSTGATFILEKNVTISFDSAAGDLVYAKANCTIINHSSGTVSVNCNPMSVGFNNAGTGTIVIANICQLMTYDYSQVGGSACTKTLTQLEGAKSSLLIYPNPVSGGAPIRVAGALSPAAEARIFSLSGTWVKQVPDPENGINTSDLLPGRYFMLLQDGDRMLRTSFHLLR